MAASYYTLTIGEESLLIEIDAIDLVLVRKVGNVDEMKAVNTD